MEAKTASLKRPLTESTVKSHAASTVNSPPASTPTVQATQTPQTTTPTTQPNTTQGQSQGQPEAKKRKSGSPSLAEVMPALKNIEYQPLRRNKKGMPMVNFGAPVRFQLTASDRPVVAPFGINVYVAKDAPAEERAKKESESRKSLNINLESADLLASLKQWDEHNVRVAIAKKAEFFSGDVSDDLIRARYTSFISPGKDSYPPQLRTKVDCTGQFALTVLEYDSESNTCKQVPWGKLHNKRARIVPVCEGRSFWFQSKQWGMSLVTTHILLFPQDKPDDWCFEWQGAIPQFVSEPDRRTEKVHVAANGDLVVPLFDQPPAVSSAGMSGSSSVLFQK
jgi:hypothetical protein